jgi:hypothetical protein
MTVSEFLQTRFVPEFVIQKALRDALITIQFSNIRAARLTTDLMNEYREKHRKTGVLGCNGQS